jgi:uncharacterized protein (DUF433 family)
MGRGKQKTPAHQQFSLRVRTPVFENLQRKTTETQESRNALAERYIDEGIKMDDYPDIYFREGAIGRRASIIGTRLDVWQVMDTLRNSDNSPEGVAEYLGVPVSKVRAAVRYYAGNRDEVDEFAARATAIAERAEAAWRAEQEILELVSE